MGADLTMKIPYKVGIGMAALFQGGYMVFDGIHEITTGAYFGKSLGPWAQLTCALGISPRAMAPVFVILGSLWVVALLAFLLRLDASIRLLGAAAVLSLFYIPIGTILSILVLLLLVFGRPRAGRLAK